MLDRPSGAGDKQNVRIKDFSWMYEVQAQVNFDYPKLVSRKLIGPPMLETESRDLLADHPILCYRTRREVH